MEFESMSLYLSMSSTGTQLKTAKKIDDWTEFIIEPHPLGDYYIKNKNSNLYLTSFGNGLLFCPKPAVNSNLLNNENEHLATF